MPLFSMYIFESLVKNRFDLFSLTPPVFQYLGTQITSQMNILAFWNVFIPDLPSSVDPHNSQKTGMEGIVQCADA